MNYVVFVGRIFYSLIFLMTAMSHFSQATIDYATGKGVIAAPFFVPFFGVIAIVGAISIMAGYKAKGGALLIIIFLIPVTLKMHDFWNVTDPMQYKMQLSSFMKNVSMLGAAMLITYFGSGPLSIDQNKKTTDTSPQS
jgi:putative oxidoreductase